MSDIDEDEKMLGKEYMEDFRKLDRIDGSIVMNIKLAEFMEKHLPDAFPLDDKQWKAKIALKDLKPGGEIEFSLPPDHVLKNILISEEDPKP